MKRIFTLMALAAFTLPLLAQSPNLMSYQAVIRDAENHLLTNQAVAVQISIMQGTPNSTPVYQEVHSLSTNANGLVSLEIGNGVTGDDFSLIDWANGPFFLRTETDPTGGSNYTISATTQLLSVPYAKFADEAGNTFSGIFGDLLGVPTDVSHFANDVGYLTGITGGEPAFDDWDKNVLDDFSGHYGDLAGAPTGVSHFANDAGYLTAATALWTQNGSDIYRMGGNVGIGLNTPANTLSVYNTNPYASFQTSVSGTNSTDGFKVGTRSDSHVFIWNYESTPINFGTQATTRMVIEAGGDVGIGTTNPSANLQVVGDTKFGVNGVGFNEMREVTGTTHATNSWVSFTLPTGYNETNTRVICLEIQYLGNRWAGLASENHTGGYENLTYLVDDNTMYIYYPDLSYFKGRAFRVLIMQIAP